jgi:N-acetylglucosaminyl-diphospho-decaprenol L-rhamnosyltransferase
VSNDVSRVTAAVVSFNTREDTLRCLRSLRHAKNPMGVIVVDNDSHDGSTAAIRRDSPEVLVLALDANVGFAAANNRALARVQTPYALLLNSDAELRPGAIEALLAHLDTHPQIALAGPRTLNTDGTPQISWGPDLTPLNEWRQRGWRHAVARGDARACGQLAALSQRPHAPDWLSGSCLLARVESLKQIGFFDEGYFLYEEDADLCLRLRRAHWTLAFVPEAEVVHHGGRSMSKEPQRAQIEYHRSHLRYYALHNGRTRAALLRGWLIARALLGWLGACRRGRDAAIARQHWRSVARLALGLLPARTRA